MHIVTIVCLVLMVPFVSGFTWTHDAEYAISEVTADPQIISRYNAETQSLALKLHLEKDAILTFQLFSKDAEIIKIWEPNKASAGYIQTLLPLDDIESGTYMLNIQIDQQAYQQVVWVY